MNAETVYTTDDPAVMAKWDDDQRRYREWVEAAENWASEWPDHKVNTMRSTWADGVYWVDGLRGSGPPSEMWRRSKGAWVPRRTLKAARPLVAAMEALRVSGIGVLPGMPRGLFIGISSLTHGIDVIDGRIYVTWGKPAAEQIEATGEFDPSIWRRVKLSEFYAAKEAVEAVAP